MSGLWVAYARASVTGAALALCYLALRRMLPRGAGMAWRGIVGIVLVLHLLIPLRISSPVSAYSAVPPDIVQAVERAQLIDSAILARTAPVPDAHEAVPIDWTLVAGALWAVGAAISLWRALRRYRKACRALAGDRLMYEVPALRKAAMDAGLKTVPALRLASMGPAVRGIKKPEILMPQYVLEGDGNVLYLMLLHECTHIRRNDIFKLCVLRLAEALHWWNPAVRLAARAMRKDIELLCDVAVLRALPDDGQRIDYGRALIGAATKSPPLSPAAAGASIKERIRLIGNKKRPKLWMAVVAAAACCAMAIALITLPTKQAAAEENQIASPTGQAIAINTANLEEYTRTAWLLNYADLLKNQAAYQGNVYKCVGIVQEVLSDDPYIFSFDVGEKGEKNLIAIEYASEKDQRPVIGRQYDIYADLEGTYEDLPRLNGRFCFDGYFVLDGQTHADDAPASATNLPVDTDATGGENGSAPTVGKALAWDSANALWPVGGQVQVVDFYTGKAYFATRVISEKESSEDLHFDFEPTTAADTAIVKESYGGEWSWDRRPVLLALNGDWVAASISGYPHGIETVPDNDMTGQLCMHVTGSKNHGTGLADQAHQECVAVASGAK